MGSLPPLVFSLVSALLQDTTVIENVTVIPMDEERTLPAHTVVVRDGRIAELGPSASTELGEDATVIEGTGKFLLPGLVDMHVHVGFEDELVRFVAYGVTTIRNMSGRGSHLRYRDDVLQARRIGPTLYSAAATIDSEPILFPGTTSVANPEESAAAVREAERHGWDFIKVYDSLSRASWEGILTTATQPVVGHVPFDVGLEAVLASKQRTIEHLFGYEAFCQPGGPIQLKSRPDRGRAWQTFDFERVPEAVRKTVDAGTWNCPTLVLFHQLRTLEEFDREAARDDYSYVSRAQLESWRARIERMGRAVPVLRSATSTRSKLLRALHEGGAPLLAGTDTGMPFVPAGLALHWELEHFVEAGMSPYEALVTATRAPAECLGTPEMGPIQPGIRADLLLLDANPLEDIANLRAMSGVMVRGRWHAREELDAELERLAARRTADEPR